MDNTPVGYNSEELTALSYDDNIAYEEQLPTEAERAASLAGRIGTSKVYLLSDSSAVSRPGKRKHDDNEDNDLMEEENIDGDLVYRRNAILVNGTPISHLTTTRIFAYATHFDIRPLGLEWVDDATCVLVFESNKDARVAFTLLQKSGSDLPDVDEFVPAKPFPVALWPPEERINQTLGQGQGLKGSLRMRWAKTDDVKKKGAMMESKFYQKHGISAGKELFDGRDLPPAKRRRGTYDDDEELQKARLDEELDQFLARGDEDEAMEGEPAPEDEEPAIPASPPSRMRSDYFAADGRTLLERTSVLRLHSMDTPDLSSRLDTLSSRRSRGGRRTREKPYDGKFSLSDRLQAPFSERLDWGPTAESREPSRRARGGRNRHREPTINGMDPISEGRSRKSDRSRRPNERPRKTQQELDDELDAFLRHD